MAEFENYIEIQGARVNNLKNVSVRIPRNCLTVITGLSGSGKSSLAFDTIYAEGQRRYIDTFSSYARGFIGQMERPDVDKISGLSPVICIDQKTTNRNPRSTVGTQTEVYDYLRLLYARAGEAYSYLTGEKMVHYTDEQIAELICQYYDNQRVMLLAPLVKGRKGHYKELFDRYRKKGFVYVRIDGEMQELTMGMKVDRYKVHDIELVIDRLKVMEAPRKDAKTQSNAKDEDYDNFRKRLLDSIGKAMEQGDGVMMVSLYNQPEDYQLSTINYQLPRYFSRRLMCPTTGLSYRDPAPHTFSFNSPQGACERCHGLGVVKEIDMNKIVPNRKLSIAKGAIVPLGKQKNTTLFYQIEAILNQYDCTLETPFDQLPEACIDKIMNGTEEELHWQNDTLGEGYLLHYEGITHYLEMGQEDGASETEQHWSGQYVRRAVCPVCQGARLNREALSYKILDKTIADLAFLDIEDLYAFLEGAEAQMESKQAQIAHEILKEIRDRLRFMLDVGLGYLSLNRSSDSLSGGESQRIRLATQLGSQLVNVLYILDEPSIGLHQRDNQRLISSLKALRDRGNTVIVVEHDEQIMREADYIVDIGPRAGRLGGNIVFSGTPAELLQSNTLTAKYLQSNTPIAKPVQYKDREEQWISLNGCTGNNLKHISVRFPLGKMIGVTGVSGSGKSTLINQTLYPILSKHFYRSLQDPLPYESIEGISLIDKVIAVDQSPIGRTPRSNPATYTGVFADIRQLFAQLPESQIRGWKAGRFSFNTGAGRCENCGGNGYKCIEMHYLPDVYVPCEVCGGKRYNRETLVARFKGKTIADVLDMTVNQAVEFFEAQPVILNKIKTMQDVGLGYVKLGQSSTTLSGGESQRMKLATELSRKDTGRTFYILDEPTTGLHFDDIRILLGVLRELVNRGNTVLIIEHNLDVIRACDYLIDMGIEGGKNGGEVIATGTQKDIKKSHKSLTAKYL